MGFIDDFNGFKDTLNPKHFEIYLDGVNTNLKLSNSMSEQYVYKNVMGKNSGEEAIRHDIDYLEMKYGNSNCLKKDPIYNLLDLPEIDNAEGINCARYVHETREIHMFSNSYMEALRKYGSECPIGFYIRDKVRNIYRGSESRHFDRSYTSHGMSVSIGTKFSGMLFKTTGFDGLLLAEHNKDFKNKVSKGDLSLEGTGLEYVISVPNAIPYLSDNLNSEQLTLGIHKFDLVQYLTDDNRSKEINDLYHNNNTLRNILEIMNDKYLRNSVGTLLQVNGRPMFTTIPVNCFKKEESQLVEVEFLDFYFQTNPILSKLVPKFMQKLGR